MTPAIEPLQPPPPPPAHDAYWSWLDVAMFIAFAFLSIVATLAAVSLSHLLHLLAPATELVLGQCLLYLLVIGSLYLILRTRYGRPFWRSLGFSSIYPGWLAYVAGGVMLAIGVGILGVLLRAPEIPLPFQDLLRNRSAVISLGVLVVFLGPFAEEIVFRGFLLPLFMRSIGPVAGVVVTGLLFGAMHGPEYRWSWQHVVLISAVGIVFGWARYRTGSTVPSALTHAAFNMTQFAAFLVAGDKPK